MNCDRSDHYFIKSVHTCEVGALIIALYTFTCNSQN